MPSLSFLVILIGAVFVSYLAWAFVRASRRGTF